MNREDDPPFEVNVRSNSPQANQVESFKKAALPRKIRLGCIHCDRDDFDGVAELPIDWHDIFPVQTWEESIKPALNRDPLQRSVMAWETHLGICSECFEEYDREESPPKSVLQWQETESVDSDEPDFQESLNVHPIIRQIIDRDCHVGESNSKVVRQAREFGLVDPYAIRDWIQAISGVDVGPIPERYRVRNKQEEGDCRFCGYPLYVGDIVCEYVGEMFCSITCCRKSRGW